VSRIGRLRSEVGGGDRIAGAQGPSAGFGATGREDPSPEIGGSTSGPVA
jgi:hypothetical protein